MESFHVATTDRNDEIGDRQRRAGHRVALLDVERAGGVLAFDVGVDVGDHQAEGPPQPLQRGAERPGSDRRPVPVPTEAEQEVVAVLG